MAKETGLPLMAMDNFNVNVTARGPEVLARVIEIVLAAHLSMESYTEVTYNGTKTMVFHWFYKPDKTQTKFPYPFRVEQLLPLIKGWLEVQDYGNEPDLDGSCSKGWRIFTEFPYDYKEINTAWDNVGFAIQPVWAEHHK